MDCVRVLADILPMKTLSFETDTCLSLSTSSRLFSLSHSLLSVSNLARDLGRISLSVSPGSCVCFSLSIASFNYCYF